MKGLSNFQATIEAHLKARANTDPQFAAKFANKKKSIAQCCNYIIDEVRKSGRVAFTDPEIYGLAIHYYDEDSLTAPSSPPASGLIVSPVESDPPALLTPE